MKKQAKASLKAKLVAPKPPDPIDRARGLISSDPVVAVDATLTAFGATRGYRSAQETSFYLDVLAEAILAGGEAKRSPATDPVKTLFDAHSCDALACAAFLRLLSLDDDVLTEPNMRPATALFDRVLAGRVYKDLELSTKSQAFEKRERLRNYVSQHEVSLQSHIDSLGSLDALPVFRQQMRLLFSDQATVVAIRPFLPPDITMQRLTEVFNAVAGVSDSDDEHLQAAADAAVLGCKHLRESAVSLPTGYSLSLIAALADKMRDLVLALIRAKGLADPADLKLLPSEKRLPLRHVGSPITLRLGILNEGHGHGLDVELSLEGNEHIRFDEIRHSIGPVAPGSRRFEVHGRVISPTESDCVIARLVWRNADGTEGASELLVDLLGQRADVDWDALEYLDPYPLEPISDVDSFVGRESTLRDLAKVILANTPGNARIQGQRRVGKTSVANAIAARVERLRPGIYGFVFIEAGDFNANTPTETIARLGQAILTKVRHSDPRLADIEDRDFHGGLSPLTECMEEVHRLAPDRRIVIVLDEFDSMPHPELYDRGAVASAFFQTLRSLGGKRNVGFVLVGGERMRFVIANHGQALNKFELVPLDYFDEDQYEDYRRLLCDPVSEWLDIDPSAVRVLYDASGGNPWITKLVARELFERASTSRDSDVRDDDARDAISSALPKLGTSSFQHFWDDAIQGGTEEQELVSVARRKVLLAFGTCVRDGRAPTEQYLVAAARRYGVDEPTAVDVLRGFRERSILIENGDGELNCRVPLFARWLADEGLGEIVVTMGDDDAILRRQRAQEAARPKTPELKALADRWRTYRGAMFEVEGIREWLNQFDQQDGQRLMLRVLQGLRYYNDGDIRERLRALHQYVLRDLAESGYGYTRTGRQRMRSDLVVCALEGGGSGAASLVKPYRDENAIYAARAVEPHDVPSVLAQERGGVRAVLILEDFLATGGTARARLAELHREWTKDQDWPAEVAVYVLGICGFDDAIKNCADAMETLSWDVMFHVADPLDSGDKCFSDLSHIFPDPESRALARAICFERGDALDPDHPLGYGNMQATVCFEYRCPNNSLPILWREASAWVPLFPRH